MCFLFSVFQIVKQLFQLLSFYMWKEPLAEKSHEEMPDKHKGVIQLYYINNTMYFSVFFTFHFILNHILGITAKKLCISAEISITFISFPNISIGIMPKNWLLVTLWAERVDSVCVITVTARGRKQQFHTAGLSCWFIYPLQCLNLPFFLQVITTNTLFKK